MTILYFMKNTQNGINTCMDICESSFHTFQCKVCTANSWESEKAKCYEIRNFVKNHNNVEEEDNPDVVLVLDSVLPLLYDHVPTSKST